MEAIRSNPTTEVYRVFIEGVHKRLGDLLSYSASHSLVAGDRVLMRNRKEADHFSSHLRKANTCQYWSRWVNDKPVSNKAQN